MKHIKLIIPCIIVCLALVYSYKPIKAAAKERGPGFELRNQSSLNIMFRLFVNDKQIADTQLAPNHIYQWQINLDDPIAVEVYEPLTKNILSKVAIDAKGKTKYIGWDPKRYNKPNLYFFPQKSDDVLAPNTPVSPFDLTNNVNQEDIKRIR